MRGPPQRFKREGPVLWRAKVLAASDGSGWSIQDTEHCRRWNRVPECVGGQGWEGGDMARILSQGLIYAPSQPHTHTYTHQEDAVHQAFSTWTSQKEDRIC